mmetsp:Transcript_52890/g.172099  ORF Transcript_52890/g.172099 Transcript_52890/m.172099 type:complete len:284 (-) Transcript_52890:267-1118(-)
MDVESRPVALVVESFFSEEQLDSLKAFIQDCPEPEVPPNVLTEEYWVFAKDVLQQPCNPPEVLIGQLLRCPDVIATIGEVAGAQWSWHDYLDTDDPKVFHTDCNRRLVDCETIRTNPDWSSVVYLTNEGGATMIWQDNEFVAVQPYRGRYLLFPGDLPHGVLCAQEPKNKDRVILSITWWRDADAATGSRVRPPGCCELPGLRSTGDEDESEAGTGLYRSTVLIGKPTSVPFSDHVDEWLAQRMPVDLQTPREEGKPPAHVAVRYISDDFDPGWCPLVAHAMN